MLEYFVKETLTLVNLALGGIENRDEDEAVGQHLLSYFGVDLKNQNDNGVEVVQGMATFTNLVDVNSIL